MNSVPIIIIVVGQRLLDVKLFFKARDASHTLIGQKSFTFAGCGKHLGRYAGMLHGGGASAL
jgi:hypothetical protein